MATEDLITDETVSPVFQRVRNVRGWVDLRSYEIRQELARLSLKGSLSRY